ALCIESNSAGNTALHFAAAGGHTVCVQALLTHAGPPIELPDRALLLLTAVNRFDRQT
ncbi:Ank3, partial [Symbiodinium pilosum]